MFSEWKLRKHTCIMNAKLGESILKKFGLKDVLFWSWNSFVLGVLVMFLLAHLFGFIQGKDGSDLQSKVAAMKSILDRSFYENVDESKLTDGALKGMTDSTGDVYTRYYNAEEWTALQERVQGAYVGIGITMVANDDKQIEVVEVSADSPAEQAGLKAGDIILSVNGNKASAEKMDEVSEVVKKSDEVTLKVQRNDDTKDFVVKTAEIDVDNLSSKVVEDNLGYVKISTFDNSIAEEFKNEVEDLQSKNVDGLIIDVRDNPGGNYEQVVQICDYLLGECTIVYTQDKAGEQDIKYSDAEQCELPVVLLMNGNSASASEVLAGALRDNNRAVLVGTTSFGKGLVQGTIDFKDGTGMAVTIARYYTPSGECIHGKGINPDVKVSGSAKMQEKMAVKKLKELIKKQ